MIASVVPTTCSPPSPISRSRIAQSVRGSSSSPIRNSIITTPNSAKCCRFSVSDPTKPNTGQSQVMEAVDKATGERAAMAYLPVRCYRPYAVLVLERVPLREASSGQLLTFLAEIQEILEAYASLEIGPPDTRRSA